MTETYSWRHIKRTINKAIKMHGSKYIACYSELEMRVIFEDAIDNSTAYVLGYLDVIDGTLHGRCPTFIPDGLILDRSKISKTFRKIIELRQ